jgi:hypothetical protein
MDNPEKLVLCTLCCQFLWIVHFWLPLGYSLTFMHTRRRKTKQKHNVICIGHHYVHTNRINDMSPSTINRHEPFYHQLEVKMNLTSFSGNRNGYNIITKYLSNISSTKNISLLSKYPMIATIIKWTITWMRFLDITCLRLDIFSE